MQWRILFIVFLGLVFSMPGSACSKPKDSPSKKASVEGPVVAGMFYPAGHKALKSDVNRFLEEAHEKTFDGKIVGLIAPHAGYIYSGSVAGAAFKQVKGREYARVVVIAPSHRVAVDGAAVSTRDVYRTPLGDIKIDKEAAKDLIDKFPWVKDDEAPYAVEHSLEVELPFLQESLKHFTLVPIIVGAHERGVLDTIARDLDETMGEDTLFVASTDLSHYLPYDEAVKTDRETIGEITKGSPADYFGAVTSGKAQLCGASPVYILKEIARRRDAKLELIEYANSGDTAGDRSRVVGYAAIAVVQPESSLGAAQKKELLSLARKTVEAHVRGVELPPLPNDPVLEKKGAAFVTLKKRGQLRGCIGHIIAQGPLDWTVQQMAVAASSEDPRFPPVRPEELKDITIEISVLTPPEELKDPLSVRVGTDGLIIEKGLQRGVLLPQVPTEQGWDKMEYLNGICHKAGLPSGAWKDATIKRFQAIVFSEVGL